MKFVVRGYDGAGALLFKRPTEAPNPEVAGMYVLAALKRTPGGNDLALRTATIGATPIGKITIGKGAA